MSGIGSTIGSAIGGAPQSILSGKGLFGSVANAISPVLGNIWDVGTQVAGLALLGNGLSGLGGGSGGSSLFGGSPGSANLGGGAGQAMPTNTMQPAGSLAGMPYYSASQYANYGPNAPGNIASFGAPASPPPAALSPTGSGAAAPTSGNLSPAGGGATVPAPPLGATVGGGPGQYYYDGQSWQQVPNASPQQSPWASALSAGGSASQAYASYLQEMERLKYQPEYAATHSSPVIAPTQNPLAPVQSSPLNPPQLVV